MRIPTGVLAAARRPQQEPVPFQEMLPLKLKDSVSGKGEKNSDVSCLHEMSILLACFKKNEFNQALCNNEINSFQKCYSGYLTKRRISKEKEAKGILTPGQKNLSHKQVNRILKKFPSP